MKQSPLKRTSIRTLRSGESIPDSPPKRYVNSNGYIRLRWNVGVRQYVEVYEHRVVDGYVTTAEHVHHKNEVKDDNVPGNLAGMTASEHAAEHAAFEHERGREMAELYRGGMSTPQLARRFGVNAATVFRRITAEGVSMRTNTDYAADVAAQEVASLYRAGRSIHSLARQYRVETIRVTALIRSTGTAIRKPGRPRRASTATAENVARLAVRARSGGACERCGAARATNWHHRKNVGQGGKWCASNGLDLCGSGSTGCHGVVTVNPALAYERGWSVRSTDTPTDVPVWLAGRGWVLLSPDGAVTSTERGAA